MAWKASPGKLSNDSNVDGLETVLKPRGLLISSSEIHHKAHFLFTQLFFFYA